MKRVDLVCLSLAIGTHFCNATFLPAYYFVPWTIGKLKGGIKRRVKIEDLLGEEWSYVQLTVQRSVGFCLILWTQSSST
jgi:hypothetical protein